jgi:hypothetical protein
VGRVMSNIISLRVLLEKFGEVVFLGAALFDYFEKFSLLCPELLRTPYL